VTEISEKELETLWKCQRLVDMIANEPMELSWHKMLDQRNHWQDLARKIQKEDVAKNETFDPGLSDDF
jgi:hypothetical protein